MTLLRTLVPIGLVAASFIAGRADASDLPRRGDYAAPPAYGNPQPERFKGFYVGGNLGGGIGKTGPANTSGFVGGGQVGYNYQSGNVVVGAEADLMASNVRNNSFSEKARNKYLGSIRARAGYAMGNIMPYVTAGVAMGTTEVKSFAGKADTNSAGFAVGAGAEMMMTDNIGVRGEYLYYGLGDARYPTFAMPLKVDNSVNVIRGGLNYKF